MVERAFRWWREDKIGLGATRSLGAVVENILRRARLLFFLLSSTGEVFSYPQRACDIVARFTDFCVCLSFLRVRECVFGLDEMLGEFKDTFYLLFLNDEFMKQNNYTIEKQHHDFPASMIK